MTKLLLSIHVLAAIIAIGPVTVAASMFPAATRRALADPGDVAVLHNLHRICRVYASLGVVVPVFGLATARSLGVLGDAWLITSIVLTAAAAAVLILLVLPGQAAVLRDSALLPAQPPAPAADPDRTDHVPAGQALPDAIAAGPARVDGMAAGRGRAGGAAAGDVVADSPGSSGGAVGAGRMAARLGMVTGIFNLLWAVVVVLMIVRPGSTTGV